MQIPVQMPEFLVGPVWFAMTRLPCCIATGRRTLRRLRHRCIEAGFNVPGQCWQAKLARSWRYENAACHNPLCHNLPGYSPPDHNR